MSLLCPVFEKSQGIRGKYAKRFAFDTKNRRETERFRSAAAVGVNREGRYFVEYLEENLSVIKVSFVFTTVHIQSQINL